LAFPQAELLKTFTILPIFDTGKIFVEPILYVGWTLSFEWLFYIFYALLIAFGLRKRSQYLIYIFVSLVIIGILTPGKNIQATFLTNPIILEFCLGIIIAELYVSSINVPKAIAILCCSVGILAYVLLIFVGYGDCAIANETLLAQNSLPRVLIWGVPSAVIVVGLIYVERYELLKFNNRFMLLMGEASFAIYLLHPICLKYLAVITKKFPAIFFASFDIYVIFLFIASIMTGILYYLYVEKYLNSYFHSLLSRLKQRETKSIS
jgi:exopolysaccharide production protein ExoZ